MRAKFIFSIGLLLFCSHLSFGQLLKLQSKDSLNGKPKKQFYTTAWLKLSGFYDIQGIDNFSSMHIPSIPTERMDVPRDPAFFMDVFQSRLIFASAFQTKKLGEITSYIETDFYGNGGGGMRLRHAYLRFKNFRFGQTWSGFTDEESWANITDFDGPATGAWVRTAQLAYFIRPNKNEDILISIETPTLDVDRYLPLDTTLTGANQSIPDLVSHYEIRWPRGHFQIAGVARAIEYRNLTSGNREFLFGYGFNFSGSQIVGQRDKLIYQAAGGEGIARYLVSFGGGGWDALPDFQGELVAVPIFGGYVGFQHFWDGLDPNDDEESDWSSTFVYGYVQLDNPFEIPENTLLTGHYASANLYWHLAQKINFAVEGIYGFRTDEFESRGDNLRIQFVMEYNF